jgi:hypothetical protein
MPNIIQRRRLPKRRVLQSFGVDMFRHSIVYVLILIVIRIVHIVSNVP